MPFFMDRHDTPGATPQDVADAHMADVAISKDFGVEFFSYWFDALRGAVYCFAQAPSEQSMREVHAASHGLVPAEIIGVQENDVLRFLGQIHEPAGPSEIESPFRTIIFTDIEGSTELIDRLGQGEFMVLLSEHDLTIRRELLTWRGREVKHTGDGFLVAFDDVGAGLEFCLDVQRRFAERSESGAVPELRVKIGVTAGEPVDHNDDIFGTPVNLAARLCDAASGGEIIVAADIADLEGSGGYHFQERDPLLLKGFEEPVPVLQLLTP